MCRRARSVLALKGGDTADQKAANHQQWQAARRELPQAGGAFAECTIRHLRVALDFNPLLVELPAEAPVLLLDRTELLAGRVEPTYGPAWTGPDIASSSGTYFRDASASH